MSKKRNKIPKQLKKYELSEGAALQAYEASRHFGILFWTVTTISTTMLGGLFVSISTNAKMYPSSKILFYFLGFISIMIMIDFAISFRNLRQNEMAVAVINGVTFLHTGAGGQWKPYLFVWWTLGLLYLSYIFMEFIISPFSEINILLIILSGLFILSITCWTLYILKVYKTNLFSNLFSIVHGQCGDLYKKD